MIIIIIILWCHGNRHDYHVRQEVDGSRHGKGWRHRESEELFNEGASPSDNGRHSFALFMLIIHVDHSKLCIIYASLMLLIRSFLHHLYVQHKGHHNHHLQRIHHHHPDHHHHHHQKSSESTAGLLKPRVITKTKKAKSEKKLGNVLKMIESLVRFMMCDLWRVTCRMAWRVICHMTCDMSNDVSYDVWCDTTWCHLTQHGNAMTSLYIVRWSDRCFVHS